MINTDGSAPKSPVDLSMRGAKKTREIERHPALARIPPTICLSRRIGVGVQEIAGHLAERIGYRVIDREIIRHIPHHEHLSEKTIAFFDELYPGIIHEYLSLIAGEKGFATSDNVRHLFSTILSLASLEPTIFIGRGAFLILPRKQTLAVRFTAAREHRIQHLAEWSDMSIEAARETLERIDRRQNDFFKVAFGKKRVLPEEFDMVINCDFITDPRWAAEIVAAAFWQKFGSQISGN